MVAAAAEQLPWDAWAAVFRPHLSPLLIDEAAFRWLRGIARHVPGDCLGVLELRLAAGSPAVDFAVRLGHPDQARRVAPRLSSARARRFLSSWARRRAELRPVASIWLEFDSRPEGGRGDAERPLPEPVLCARLGGATEPAWVVDTLLPAMRGEPLPAAQRRTVQRLLAAVPARARVLYAFSLLARRGEGVRLELYGLEPAAMVAYSRGAVSPAAAEQVASVAHLVSGADRFHLSFDVGPGEAGAGGVRAEISPRVGVECGLRRQPRREPRWAELLDRLVANGLASPTKREALLAWPGQDSLWTAPGRWPAAAVGRGGHGVRCLSHLKLVLHAGRAPEAKAYLLFQHLPARSPGAQGTASTGAGRPNSRARLATRSR